MMDAPVPSSPALGLAGTGRFEHKGSAVTMAEADVLQALT
jgi:hypothetical protein